MSNEPQPPVPPSAPKPQLPPAAKPQLPPAGPRASLPDAPKTTLPVAPKSTLPSAPKLSLAGGAKPAFKPDVSGDPFAVETARPEAAQPETAARPAAAPATISTIARPPSIGVASPAATRAPGGQTSFASPAPALVPVDEDAPKWAGAIAGLGMVASLAFAVLLFLELKPTL